MSATLQKDWKDVKIRMNYIRNSNWYSNVSAPLAKRLVSEVHIQHKVILIPGFVSQVCLLMKDELTATHLAKCVEMAKRSFDFFYRTNKPGFLKGANILDIGRIGIDAGLLDSNFTLLRDAFHEVHKEMTVHNKPKDDGIRPDGTFGKQCTYVSCSWISNSFQANIQGYCTTGTMEKTC